MGISNEGTLLHQCQPISAMTLLYDSLLVLGEGPCILSLKRDHEEYDCLDKFVRHQLFPNQLTITGIHWVEQSCGSSCRESPWNGFDEEQSVALVLAGNHGLLITLDRFSLEIQEGEKFPENAEDSLAFNYIPITARWFNDGRTLVLLSVFNYIVVYERAQPNGSLKGLKEVSRFECEQENLYSGTMIGDTLEDLVIFSGTTFQGILVWNVGEDGNVCIRHKLTGHKGIPFSLEFDLEQKILVSASDDRNVIVWEFSDGNESGNPYVRTTGGTMKKAVEKAQMSHKLTGHEARCWKAISVYIHRQGYIFSVGEDSSIRIHGLNIHKFTKVWKAHDGASIYHCAYSNRFRILYTAAHDGSVFQWKNLYQETGSAAIVPFDVIPRDWESVSRLAGSGSKFGMNKDYPRSIILWTQDFIVASMDSGRIIGLHLTTLIQYELYVSTRFKRYSVMGICEKNNVLLVGGLDGDLFAFKLSDRFKAISLRIKTRFTDRLASLIWTEEISTKILNIIMLRNEETNMFLIVCLEKAVLYKIVDAKDGIQIVLMKTFDLALERPGIPAALLNDDILILGDETGNLLTFSLKSDISPQIQIIKDVHPEGITNIVNYNSVIMTAGRYGGIKSFRLEDDGLEVKLLQVHEFIPPFEWVGKLMPIEDKDLLLVGFQKGDVVLYSWKDKRILTEIVSVGGGHRRWDANYTNEYITFAYIRDKEMYYSTMNIFHSINSILKTGLHCKTINCGIELMPNSTFIATGSEDGTIRVFKYDMKKKCHQPTYQINNHASSVRTLVSVQLDDQRALLFSAGGRSEVLIFHIGLDGEELTPCGRITLVKSKNRDAEIDTRIMDLKVFTAEDNSIFCFCACSDGIVRVFRYSLMCKKCIIVSVLHGNDHCITRLQVVPQLKSLLVFGVTTNGNLLQWNWNPPQLDPNLEFIKNPEIVQKNFMLRLRNAAIMSFKIVAAKDSQAYKFVVGSDDSSVSCWEIRVPEDIYNWSSSNISEIFVEDQSQRGAVVDVDIVTCENNSISVYSCSNDQVVLRLDGNTGSVLGTTYAGVSDCQGFIVNYANQFVSCYGNGISWVKIP